MNQFNLNKASPLMRRQSALVMMSNRRLMSSQYRQPVRQGGISKGLVATLVIAAAGFAYYKRTIDEKSKCHHVDIHANVSDASGFRILQR